MSRVNYITPAQFNIKNLTVKPPIKYTPKGSVNTTTRSVLEYTYDNGKTEVLRVLFPRGYSPMGIEPIYKFEAARTPENITDGRQLVYRACKDVKNMTPEEKALHDMNDAINEAVIEECVKAKSVQVLGAFFKKKDMVKQFIKGFLVPTMKYDEATKSIIKGEINPDAPKKAYISIGVNYKTGAYMPRFYGRKNVKGKMRDVELTRVDLEKENGGYFNTALEIVPTVEISHVAFKGNSASVKCRFYDATLYKRVHAHERIAPPNEEDEEEKDGLESGEEEEEKIEETNIDPNAALNEGDDDDVDEEEEEVLVVEEKPKPKPRGRKPRAQEYEG